MLIGSVSLSVSDLIVLLFCFVVICFIYKCQEFVFHIIRFKFVTVACFCYIGLHWGCSGKAFLLHTLSSIILCTSLSSFSISLMFSSIFRFAYSCHSLLSVSQSDSCSNGIKRPSKRHKPKLFSVACRGPTLST